MMRSRNKSTVMLLEVLMVLAGILVLIPLVMIFVNSVKNPREAAMLNLYLPTEWRWDNFGKVFSKAKILRGYFNSFVISGFTVLCINIFASMAAFVIQRSDKRAAKGAYYLFVIGLIVPASIIPTIKMMMGLHIHNTYFGIVMYYTAVMLPFSIFLLTGFMKTIPKELDEASIVDGCGYLKLFFRIVFPLLQPALITVTIVVVLAVWNDFFGPFYLISDSTKWTVTISVFNFVNKYSTEWGLVFADMVIVIMPVILLYFSLQKYIIDGMTAGALKS